VSLASTDGERHLPVEEFIAGAYYADKNPDELLVDIKVPLTDAQDAVYRKHQTRERPAVGVALVRDHESCRLVVGAVGETPETWTFNHLQEIVPEDIAEQLDPTPDLEGSVRYKRHLAAVYVRRAVEELTGRRDR
jgi:carbon-monoxide dehydrogenase medium subunit